MFGCFDDTPFDCNEGGLSGILAGRAIVGLSKIQLYVGKHSDLMYNPRPIPC
jgi:hypothetical protein